MLFSGKMKFRLNKLAFVPSTKPCVWLAIETLSMALYWHQNIAWIVANPFKFIFEPFYLRLIHRILTQKPSSYQMYKGICQKINFEAGLRLGNALSTMKMMASRVLWTSSDFFKMIPDAWFPIKCSFIMYYNESVCIFVIQIR